MNSLRQRYGHAGALVRTHPAKVLGALKRKGFEPAIRDFKHGIFRDGVEVKNHPLRRGWVSVQWVFANSLRRSDKKTSEDWRRAIESVYDALKDGSFLVRYVDDDPSIGMIEVVERGT